MTMTSDFMDHLTLLLLALGGLWFTEFSGFMLDG